jgi:hypothetical protein
MHGKRILLALAALGSLRLDFVVAPGADPSRILLDIEAEVPLSLDPEGNLMLGGELFQPLRGRRGGIGSGHRAR